MTIQDAIVANFNRTLPREELQRILLDHPFWYGGGVSGMQWLASSEPATVKLASRIRGDLIGEPRAISRLDDYVLDLPDTVELLTIVPSDSISLGLERDEIADLQRFARGYRVERAMHERDYARVRAYQDFLLPYEGHGEGSQVVVLQPANGPMVPAFTTTDMAACFVETGNDTTRTAIEFASVDGELLVGAIGPTMAQGVVVNFASAQAVGFDLNACRLVMGQRRGGT